MDQRVGELFDQYTYWLSSAPTEVNSTFTKLTLTKGLLYFSHEA